MYLKVYNNPRNQPTSEADVEDIQKHIDDLGIDASIDFPEWAGYATVDFVENTNVQKYNALVASLKRAGYETEW
jgi:hypothetical protein